MLDSIGKRTWVRIPVVPQVNITPGNAETFAVFLEKMNVEPPSEGYMESIRKTFSEYGIKTF